MNNVIIATVAVLRNYLAEKFAVRSTVVLADPAIPNSERFCAISAFNVIASLIMILLLGNCDRIVM
jgi:hypothetical protein